MMRQPLTGGGLCCRMPGCRCDGGCEFVGLFSNFAHPQQECDTTSGEIENVSIQPAAAFEAFLGRIYDPSEGDLSYSATTVSSVGCWYRLRSCLVFKNMILIYVEAGPLS